MRRALVILFWLCTLGSVIQVPLLGYELWILATEATFTKLTLWALLTEHLTFLSWVTDIPTAILGAEFGDMILGLPAILVTTIKLILGTVIGIWALDKVREVDALQESGEAVKSPG